MREYFHRISQWSKLGFAWLAKQINTVFSLPDEVMLKPVFIGTWIFLLFSLLVATFGVVKLTSIYTELPSHSIEETEYRYHGATPSNNNAESVTSSARAEQQTKASNHDSNSGGQPDKEFMDFIRDKRDLAAQEGMWKAAVFLVGLTAMQSVFGAIGLVLIYRTLKATRDTVDVARDAERGYMFATNIYLQRIGRNLEWIIDWTNQGNTPIVKSSTLIDWEIVNRLLPTPKGYQINRFQGSGGSIGARTAMGIRCHIDQFQEDYLLRCLNDNDYRVLVWSSVIFEDVFEKESKTNICFEIISNVGEFDIADCPEGVDFTWNTIELNWADKK